MATTLMCLILIPNIFHYIFCYSVLDNVSTQFIINGSKWSLFTGKIWTCGHKKVTFGLTLQGGL